jgi:hypothetical protein
LRPYINIFAMTKYLLIPFLLSASIAKAQVPEDALRYSFFPQNGSARSLSIGGAIGSLGGDITSTFVNPAGLGNYRTGEVVFSPGFLLNSNKINFRDTRSQNRKNNFSFGASGIVFGQTNPYDQKSSSAFSLVVTQTASFNNNQYYKGYNNFTSISEQWAEDASYSNLSFDDIRANPSYAHGASPAIDVYLVDTFNNGTIIKGLPEFVLNSGQALLQEKTLETRGGIYDIALGYGWNRKDKWLYGLTVGLPILHYSSNTTLRESDTSNNADNNFNYFTYNDKFTTSGVGLNAKFGIIYKPQEYIRLGLALHTPTLMFSMRDERTSFLEADTEDYNQLASASSTTFTNGQPSVSKYMMLTPWRAIISGSYVFREVEDVRKQKGFISADIEYTRYRGARFDSQEEQPTDEEKNYFNGLNNVIKGQYKGNFNFRVGGELKFNIIMARLGFAYYSNPYKDAALKASRMLLSGGLGYRHRGFFVDLTYVHAFNRDVDFAYRLADKANTFASVKNQRGNIAATVGIKF